MIGNCSRRHRHQEFVPFLDHLDTTVERESGTAIHVVMDNYGTHKHPKVREWFERHPEFVPHFTPTSGSWLNQVERFFAQITDQRIRSGSFRSVGELEAAIGATCGRTTSGRIRSSGPSRPTSSSARCRGSPNASPHHQKTVNELLTQDTSQLTASRS